MERWVCMFREIVREKGMLLDFFGSLLLEDRLIKLDTTRDGGGEGKVTLFVSLRCHFE